MSTSASDNEQFVDGFNRKPSGWEDYAYADVNTVDEAVAAELSP